MRKRFLAMLLTLGMLLSLVPGQVFARGPVIIDGTHTEHHFEPVTILPEAQEPTETVAPEPSTQAQDLGEESVSGQVATTSPTESESEETKLPKRDTETHMHCIYGASCEDFRNGRQCTDPTHGEAVEFDIPIGSFEELYSYMSSNTLRAGSYVLTEDISCSSQIIISETVNLCLNGHTMNLGTASVNDIFVQQGGTLNICDCSQRTEEQPYGSGKISRVNASAGTGSPNYYSLYFNCAIRNNGTVNMYGGTIYVEGSTNLMAIDNSSSGMNSTAYLNLYSGALRSKATGSGTVKYVFGLHCFSGGSGAVARQYNDSLIEATGNSNTSTGIYGVYIYSSGTYELHDGRVYATGSGNIRAIYTNNKSSMCYVYGGLVEARKTNPSQSMNSGNPVGIYCFGQAICSGGRVESDCYGIEVASASSSSIGTATIEGDAYIYGKLIGIRLNNQVNINGGTVTGAYGVVANSATGYSAAKRIVNMTGGTVSGTTNDGIYITFGNPVLEMTGGTVTGAKNGINIGNVNASATVSGGNITGNTNGINVTGTLTLEGGSVTGSTYGVYHNGAAFKLSGGPAVSGKTADVYLSTGKMITVTGALSPAQGSYSVKSAQAPEVNAPVRITDGWHSYHGETPVTTVETTTLFTSADGHRVGILNTATEPAGTTANNEVHFYIPLYDITVKEEKCTITGVPAEATTGTTIAAKVTPDEGYSFDSFYVYNTEGEREELDYTDNGNGTYTFTMPDYAVTIEAVCKQTHIHTMSVDCHMSESEDDPNVDFDIPISSYDDLKDLDQDGEALNGTIVLAKGSYYLTNDVSVDAVIQITDAVDLCLNGHKLTFSGENHIFLQNTDSDLRICDCNGNVSFETTAEKTGGIIGTSTSYGLIRVDGPKPESGLELYGVKVHSIPTAIRCLSNSSVKVYDSHISAAGRLVFKIEDPTSNVIWMEKGSLHLEGGTIYAENSATYPNSSAYGIRDSGASSIELLDAQINAVSGSAQAYGIYTASTGVRSIEGCTIDARTTSSGAYGIQAENSGALTITQCPSVSATGNGSVYGLLIEDSVSAWVSDSAVSAEGNGSIQGLMTNESASVEVSDSTITATGKSGETTGIKKVSTGTLTLSGTEISATVENGNTYGIYGSSNTISLTGCKVNAELTGSGTKAMGILGNGSELIVSDSEIYATGNQCSEAYGILIGNMAKLTDSSVQATAAAGRIYGISQNGTLEIDGKVTINGSAKAAEGTTFTGNAADIYLPTNKVVTIGESHEVTDTYSVYTDVVPRPNQPVRITLNWDEVHASVTQFPFVDARAKYDVRKLAAGEYGATVNNELYLTLYDVEVETQGPGTVVFGNDDQRSYAVGDTVQFTATAEAGGSVDRVTATYVDENGTEQTIELTPSADDPNTYTFTMPAEDVTVTVRFEGPHEHYMAADTEKGLPTPNQEDPNHNDSEYVLFNRRLGSQADLESYMDANGVLQPGNYVLTNSFAFDKPITLNGEVNLCLKGQTLNMGGNAITVESGTLNICDCDTTTAGLITGTAADGVIKVSQGATMNLYGGTFASSTGTVIHNWGTVNTDGLISQDSNGNTSGSTTRITGPKDVIVNEFRAELNVTNASVYTGKHTTLIMNKAGTVTARATYMETPLGGGSYTCAIYNAPFETGGIIYGGSATVEEGTMVTTPVGTSGTRGGYYGIYNEAGSVVVNGGWIEVYDRGIVNCDQMYTPLAGGVAKKNNVTVNGGYIRATVYGIYNIGAEVRITGGTIFTDGSEAYWQGGDASQEDWTEIIASVYNINGGTVDISGEDTLIWSLNGMHALCNCGGVVNIHDGTFRGLGNRGVIYNGPLYALNVSPQPEKGIPCEIYMEGGLVTHSDTDNWRYDDAPTKGIYNNGEHAKTVMTGGTIDMTHSAMKGSFGIYNTAKSTVIMSGAPYIETLTGDIYLAKDVTIRVAEDGKLLTRKDKEDRGYYTVWTEEIPTKAKPYVQITTGWYPNYEQERPYLFRDARETYQVFQLEKPVPYELYLVLHNHYMAVDWETGHPDPETPNVPGCHADGTPVGDRVYFDLYIDQQDIPQSGSLTIGDAEVYRPTDATYGTYTYVLKSNLVLKAGQSLVINGTVDLCLAGNKIILDGGKIDIATSDLIPDHVRICDCKLFNDENPVEGESGIYGTNISSALISCRGSGSIDRSLALYGILMEATGNSSSGAYGVQFFDGTAVAESCTIHVNSTANGSIYGLWGNGTGLGVYGGSVTAESNGSAYGIQCLPGSTPGSLVVDGTGITSTAGTGTAYGIFHNGGGAGTIKGATITTTSDGNYVYGMMIMPGNGVSPTTVTDCTVTATSAAEQNGISCYGIAITGASPVEVKGGTVSATGNLGTHGIFAVSGANFTADNVEIKAVSHKDVANGIYTGSATVTAKDSTKIEAVANTGDAYGINAGGSTVTAENGVKIHALAENRDAYGIYVGGSTVTVDKAEINAVSNSNGIADGIENMGTTTIYSGTITGGRYGIAHMSGTLNMCGSPVVNGPVADIYLAMKQVITVIGALGEPKKGAGRYTFADTYSVLTEEKLDPKTNPIRITTGWDNHHDYGDGHPFTSVDFYGVYTLPKEIPYLVTETAEDIYFAFDGVPVVLYLTEGVTAQTDTASMLEAILNADSEEKIFDKSKNHTLIELTRESQDESETQVFHFNPVKDIDGNDTAYQFTADTTGAQGERLILSYKVEGIDTVYYAYINVTPQVYKLSNSLFVLDYGITADLTKNGNLYTKDILPGTGFGMNPSEEVNSSISLEAYTTELPSYVDVTQGITDGKTLIVTSTGGNGVMGNFTITDDYKTALYTPRGTMETADVIYMVLRAHKLNTTVSDLGSADPTKEVELFKQIKIIPANVVYYEDTIFKYTDTTGNEITVANGNNATATQDGDRNSPYGSDSTYAEYVEGNLGSLGSYTTIHITEDGEVLSFDFTGTGFELVGSTTMNSGMMILTLSKGGSVVY
ncbi:MAG: hypothetical protein J6K89_06280, partial [Oscillospiraceae bacterium]|nr:hypothetical protein [Oscillospiraceae bacterium]